MARIPDEEIERLKRQIPVERLVTGFGVELKRTGVLVQREMESRRSPLGSIAPIPPRQFALPKTVAVG